MAAFNAEVGEAMRTRWLHFPHIRFHSSRVTVMETPDDFAAEVAKMSGQEKGGEKV